MYSAKSSGNSTLSCNNGSTRVPPECPLNCLEVQESIGRMRIKQYWHLFFSLPPFARKLTQASTVHCKVPTNCALNLSIRSSNRTAPSSSRGMFLSCHSNLIMSFDTAKQPWLNGLGLTSIQNLSQHDWKTNSQQVSVLASPLQKVSLCLWTVERSQWAFLLTFLWRIYWFHSQCEPIKLFGL